MRPFTFLLLSVFLPTLCSAGLLYEYPHDGSGVVSASSWVYPDGSDSDMYSYDLFKLEVDTLITEVRWRGGYENGIGVGGVFDFTIHFYETLANDYQPICGNPELEETVYIARYHVNSKANETYIGTINGTPMYDYSYTLPAALLMLKGHYWIKIEGLTTSFPFWGLARGTGGNSVHFSYSTGAHMFQNRPNDLCFALYGNQSQTVVPASVTLNLGKNTSGSVADLATADGVDYVVCKFFVPNQQSPIVQFQVDGTTGLKSLSAYSFAVRAHTLTTGAFQITAEAYNFGTATFDSAVTSALGSAYGTTTVVPSDPAAHLGTAGAVRARIQVRQTGPSTSILPCSGFDQALWNLQN